jgi:hypothetical protein
VSGVSNKQAPLMHRIEFAVQYVVHAYDVNIAVRHFVQHISRNIVSGANHLLGL